MVQFQVLHKLVADSAQAKSQRTLWAMNFKRKIEQMFKSGKGKPSKNA